MENNSKRTPSIVAWIAGLAFAAAAAVGAYQYRIIEDKDSNIATVSSTADSLNVVRGNLESEIEMLSDNLNKEMAEGDRIEKELGQVNALLSQKSAALRNAKAQTGKLQKQKDEEIALLSGQINELSLMKSQMEQELTKIPQLESDKALLQTNLAKWEADYATLAEDFKKLDKKHALLIFDAPGDNFRVEALGNNSKLTSKAKKTKTIKVSFLMPEYLQKEAGGEKTLYLSLFDSKIKPLAGWTKEVNVMSPGSSQFPIQVHAMKNVDYSKNPQVVEFTVQLNDKMAPGLYQGKVYADDDYLGTVDFKLRDSFLFF